MCVPKWTFPKIYFLQKQIIPKDVSQKPTAERIFPKLIFQNFFHFFMIFYCFFIIFFLYLQVLSFVFVFHNFFCFFTIFFCIFYDFFPFFYGLDQVWLFFFFDIFDKKYIWEISIWQLIFRKCLSGFVCFCKVYLGNVHSGTRVRTLPSNRISQSPFRGFAWALYPPSFIKSISFSLFFPLGPACTEFPSHHWEPSHAHSILPRLSNLYPSLSSSPSVQHVLNFLVTVGNRRMCTPLSSLVYQSYFLLSLLPPLYTSDPTLYSAVQVFGCVCLPLSCRYTWLTVWSEDGVSRSSGSYPSFPSSPTIGYSGILSAKKFNRSLRLRYKDMLTRYVHSDYCWFVKINVGLMLVPSPKCGTLTWWGGLSGLIKY